MEFSWDKRADFAKYASYSWRDGTHAKNPLVHQPITIAVSYQLAMKGIRQVDSDADFNVTYHAFTQREMTLSTATYGYTVEGWQYGGYPAGRAMASKEFQYTVGTLIVDIWDAREERLLWRGKASETVKENPGKIEKIINKAVEKMLKKFPPPSG